jgi:hypothetical protein
MVWDKPVRAADGLTEPAAVSGYQKRSQTIWAPHRAVGEVVSQPTGRRRTWAPLGGQERCPGFP